MKVVKGNVLRVTLRGNLILYALQHNRLVRWGAPVAWMGLIFYLSAQSTLPNLTPGAPDLQSIAGHLSMFAVLAALWWWALRSIGVRHPAAWAFMIAVLYGMLDEFHQSFVPGRTQDPFDLALDAVGAAVALALLTGAARRSRSRALRNPSSGS